MGYRRFRRPLPLVPRRSSLVLVMSFRILHNFMKFWKKSQNQTLHAIKSTKSDDFDVESWASEIQDWASEIQDWASETQDQASETQDWAPQAQHQAQRAARSGGSCG